MLARRVLCVGLVFVMPVLASCGKNDETPTGPGGNGSVMVTATTTGVDLDTDYSVTVAGLNGNVAANGSVTIQGVAAGNASVQLGGIAGNCTVTGSNPVAVTVVADQTANVAFAVTCAQISVSNVDSLIAAAIDSLEVALFTALNIDSVPQLDDFSFAAANSLFLQALTLSPSNDTASFGAAATTLMLLEDDPAVRALVDAWDAWLEEDAIPPLPPALMGPAVSVLGSPLAFPTAFSTGVLEDVVHAGVKAVQAGTGPLLTHDPPPSIIDHQTVLRDVVAPALIEAADHMAEVTNMGFVFTVTEAMQGELPIDADPLELDYTEIFAIQAGLQLAIGAVDLALAYNMSADLLDADGLVAAMTPGSPFLTLTTGGATRLSNALTRVEAAVPLVLSGLDFLEAEADDQTDDIIKYDAAGTGDGITPADLTEARDVIQDIQAALTSPTLITINAGDPDEISFTADAREFFVDPIQDFKALLPPYEVFTAMEETETVPFFRWTELNLTDWTFPDPTFSGVLPGMTNQEFIDLGIGELFFEFSLTEGYYRLITIDGQDCDAIVFGGGLGCPVANFFFGGGSIDVSGYDQMTDAWLNVWESMGNDVYGQGPYTVVDNQDGTHTIDLNLVDQQQNPIVLAATFTDMPGYTSTDQFFRNRGGSTLVFSYLGSVWVFEKQD